jgi:hypothetical protein
MLGAPLRRSENRPAASTKTERTGRQSGAAVAAFTLMNAR